MIGKHLLQQQLQKKKGTLPENKHTVWQIVVIKLKINKQKKKEIIKLNEEIYIYQIIMEKGVKISKN